MDYNNVHYLEMLLYIATFTISNSISINFCDSLVRVLIIKFYYVCFYVGKCLYNTQQQLFKLLKRFCKYPHTARASDITKEVSFRRQHTVHVTAV